MTGTGSGILAAEAVATWWGSLTGRKASPHASILAPPMIPPTGICGRNILLTQFEPSGERGNKAQVNVSFASDGEMTYSAVTT